MTLRYVIEPLLEDFKRANGKGSMAIANIAMTKIIEALLDQLELLELRNASRNDPEIAKYISDVWKYGYDREGFDETSTNVSSDTPPSDGPPPPPGEPENSLLLQAIHALHEANYVIGSDYTSIVDHLKGNADIADIKQKIRNKPGRKPDPNRPPSTRKRIRRAAPSVHNDGSPPN